MTGAQIIIETLLSLGVDTVFGYPGAQVIDVYDALFQKSDCIRHILTAHEQGAAHAADGYARVTGKPGVVIATSGPGATNLVTGIANAYLDSVPMVAITGNVAVSYLGRDSFQEVDIVGITLPIVKHSYIVRDVNKLESVIREAFRIANSGRKGPVLIDIPKSVQIDQTEYNGSSDIAEPSKKKPLGNLTEALDAIEIAKRPYLYVGGGVISSGAEQEAIKLAEHLSAPIGLSMMGLSAIPASHPLNLGMSGMHGRYAASLVQSKADLIIACGVRFSDRATGNRSKYSENRRIIHIDIDHAELGKNVRPTIEICGDVRLILKEITSKTKPCSNLEWLAEINKIKSDIPTPEQWIFSPHNIIRTVRDNMPDDAIIATDVGQHQMWVAQSYPFSKSRTYLTSGGLGAMGFGLGAAIGGCIGSGSKRTVHFTSDGSFGMNLIELATAVTQKLPIVTVILNNGVLGMVRQWQNMFYEQRYSQTTLERSTNFVKLAEAFGAVGYRVNTLEGLDSALKNMPDNCPSVIDCVISKDEMVLPMIPPDGSIDEIRTEL